MEGTSHPCWIQHAKDIPSGGVEGHSPGGRRLQVTPRIHPVGRMLTFSLSRRGTQRALMAERSTVGSEEVQPEEPPWHFPGQSTTGQGDRMEVMGSPETVGPSMKSEVEGTAGPRQGLSRTSTTLTQRQEHSQCWSHQKTMLLPTRHSGTLRNLPVPEDH